MGRNSTEEVFVHSSDQMITHLQSFNNRLVKWKKGHEYEDRTFEMLSDLDKQQQNKA